MSSVRLTVICVAYKRPEPLRVLIHSFMSQTSKNFVLDIVHDGPDDGFDAMARQMKENYGSLVRFSRTMTRYNDYGHSLREIALRRCDTEFLMITNDDNYYAPLFIERMFKKIDDEKLDLVLCDMIHNHNRPGDREQGPYKPFITFPQKNHIDMGAFIVRTSIAQSVGFGDKSFAADGVFVDKIMASRDGGIRWGKLDQILFVHN